MKQHAKRVAKNTKVRFAAIGVINTSIDFVLLNIFAHAVGLPRIPSNLLSASVAMVFSFFANRSVVFKSNSGDKKRQAIMFLVVTVTGVYLIQNMVIFAFADLWLWPLETVRDIIGILDEEIFITNGAKTLATAVTLVWNFLFYDRLVFGGKKSDE